MSEQGEIVNKVANSGLINFDISDLIPKGTRKGIDLKDFLFEGLILREADFRQKISEINPEDYKDAYVYIYNSADAVIPLWAYFEVITLGQFSRFLGCLVKSSREKLNQDFTIIPKRSNSLELVVNSLIELRNATMHNSAIFDANFSSGVSKALKRQIKQDLGLSTFTCVFIEDYFILLIWILNLLKFDSGILIEYINQFNEIVERFDKSLDNRDIFFKIISTNRKTSIQQLSKFIDKK